MKRLSVFLFLFAIIIYFITSAGNTPYNYFTRLADAFLHGRYWLEEQPPWLSELVPAEGERYYTIQPPMPAILSIPLVAIFGKNFPQQYIAHFLGAGLVILTAKVAYLIKGGKKLALWGGLLIGFGSIVWYLSARGSVWYLGQVSAAFFLTAALAEALSKKRASLIGAFLGAAYLSRLHTILSLPFFLYLLDSKPSLDKQKLKKYFLLFTGILPFLGFDAIYNFVRFNVPWDKGYFLVPGILDEPWFSRGMLNPIYIVDHLKLLFWSFPKLQPSFPYIQPSWMGLAIWITTPAFVFSLRSPAKEGQTKMAWLAIFLIFLLLALRGGTGWTQFGYRYAVDFYPFLTLLTIKGVARDGLKWHHWFLLALGILVNLWGVLWINKFGWVSY
jgi:hypothetical protein